jgi:hypothetical protein
VARVSIYVSDELKARMDAAGEAINWSEVARPAFHTAVAAHEHRNRKGDSMSSVIKRLRASKEEYVAEIASYGKEAGRKWAQDEATYIDLKRVSTIEPPSYHRYDSDYAFASLRRAVDPEDELGDEDLANYLGVEKEDLTEEFVTRFIEGAQEVYKEVKDDI